MLYTRNNLIEEVLRIVGVWQTGQEPSAEDKEAVDRAIDGKLAELNDLNIVYVQDVEAIEARFFRPLAIIIAGSVEIGTPPDSSSVEQQERRLRNMQRLPRASSPLRTCPY